MSDDEDTWRRQKRRGTTHMGDDDRAMLSSASRRRVQTPALGIPDPEIETAEITSPIDLFDRDLSASEVEIVKRSRRNSEDPATYADVVKLAEQLMRARRDERSNNTERANQLMQLLNRPPDEAQQKLEQKLDKRLQEVERPMRVIKWIAGAVLAGTAGMLLKTADFIASSSELRGETTIRLQHMETGLVRVEQALERAINALSERRYSPTPDRAWLNPPAKDPHQ